MSVNLGNGSDLVSAPWQMCHYDCVARRRGPGRRGSGGRGSGRWGPGRQGPGTPGAWGAGGLGARGLGLEPHTRRLQGMHTNHSATYCDRAVHCPNSILPGASTVSLSVKIATMDLHTAWMPACQTLQTIFFPLFTSTLHFDSNSPVNLSTHDYRSWWDTWRCCTLQKYWMSKTGNEPPGWKQLLLGGNNLQSPCDQAAAIQPFSFLGLSALPTTQSHPCLCANSTIAAAAYLPPVAAVESFDGAWWSYNSKQ